MIFNQDIFVFQESRRKGKVMVDKARFELAASSLRTKRSAGLIYLPIRICDSDVGYKPFA